MQHSIVSIFNLEHALAEAGLDAAALNPGPTLTYLSGLHFHLMERPVVLLVDRTHDPVIVLPELEIPKVDLFPYKVNAFVYGEDPSTWEAVFRKAIQSLALDGKKIGVDPRQMRLLEFRQVHAGAPEADFPDAAEALASLRLRKDPTEVAAMRRAVRIAEDALEATLPQVKFGSTEREIASELMIQMLQRGSDAELPFPPIVSSGPNSANPHASPSDRRIQEGDLLVVDWGAVSAEFKKVAEVVHSANEAGRAAGRPGVPCANVDIAARNLIAAAGYGTYFTHRTGHGIGMEGHEEPYMRGDNMQMLVSGMAYTVEPGIYLPGRGGARIEDNVVVTEDGVEVLSDMPRELRVVG